MFKPIVKAEGEAQANKVLTSSLTPELIQRRGLDLTEKVIAKWNGTRPLVESAESGMLLNVGISK